MKLTGRIGIIGGTFNPIHLGHLMIAEMAQETYELDRVIFVPAYHPPHKHDDVIDAQYRYEMTAAAVMDNPKFTISDVEFKREGPSYTVDTIKYFRSQYGEDKEYYFIAGTDTIQDLPNWKYIHELLSLCHFIGAVRPDGSAAIEKLSNTLAIWAVSESICWKCRSCNCQPLIYVSVCVLNAVFGT